MKPAPEKESALLRTPELAVKIMEAVKTQLPAGYSENTAGVRCGQHERAAAGQGRGGAGTEMDLHSRPHTRADVWGPRRLLGNCGHRATGGHSRACQWRCVYPG